MLWAVSLRACQLSQPLALTQPLLVPLSVKLAGALVSVLTAGTLGVFSELRGHWPSTDVPEAMSIRG